MCQKTSYKNGPIKLGAKIPYPTTLYNESKISSSYNMLALVGKANKEVVICNSSLGT
jgi:hypothetical protein